jgi:hypothetical protein
MQRPAGGRDPLQVGWPGHVGVAVSETVDPADHQHADLRRVLDYWRTDASLRRPQRIPVLMDPVNRQQLAAAGGDPGHDTFVPHGDLEVSIGQPARQFADRKPAGRDAGHLVEDLVQGASSFAGALGQRLGSRRLKGLDLSPNFL